MKFFLLHLLLLDEEIRFTTMYLASKTTRQSGGRKTARIFIMKEAEHNRMISIDFDIKRGEENVK